MNKITSKTLNFAKNQKTNFLTRIAINTQNTSKLYGLCILNIQKKHFSVDYADMEKKLNTFYEMQEKAKLEYLKQIMSDKEKREAELLFEQIYKLDEVEKDYFNVKLESEMRKLFNIEIMKNHYTISNVNSFNPIEIEGNKFGFGDNLQKNIAPFYGLASKPVAAGKFFLNFLNENKN